MDVSQQIEQAAVQVRQNLIAVRDWTATLASDPHWLTVVVVVVFIGTQI